MESIGIPESIGIILVLIGILAIVAIIVVISMRSDPTDVQEAYAGKTETQKQIIRYFMIGENQGCIKKKERVWTDEDFDDYFNDAIKNTKQRALEKLGIDEEQVKEIEPISFQNYRFRDDLTNRPAFFKRGKDGKWRSSMYQANWLFFSDKQIFVCQINLNFTDDSIKDRTFEYFYKDVTNISTGEKRKNIQGAGLMPYIEFKIIVPGAEFECELNVSDEDNERSIKAMRALLREKKS